MQGSIFCHGHNPQSVKSGGAPEGNKNAVRNGLYSKYLSAEEQEQLALVGDIPGLDGEIEAARVDVMRALRKLVNRGRWAGRLWWSVDCWK
jgi:hypothetical protein